MRENGDNSENGIVTDVGSDQIKGATRLNSNHAVVPRLKLGAAPAPLVRACVPFMGICCGEISVENSTADAFSTHRWYAHVPMCEKAN